MSICRLCPNETLYGSTFCLECEAKYEQARKTSIPAPIKDPSLFTILTWCMLEELKRSELRAGKSISEVHKSVERRAAEVQAARDNYNAWKAREDQEEARIRALADKV